MSDLFGYQIAVGDTVGFNPPHYKGLARGEVVGFTPKKVRVSWATGRSWEPIGITTVFPADVMVFRP